MAADADVAAVDLDLHFGVFVPVHRRPAQGRGQQQQPQGLARQGEDPQPGAGQQAPQFVGAGVLADGVEAAVQDAFPGLQAGQQPSQGVGGLLRLLGKVAGLGLGQGAPQGCQDRRVLAHQQLHREVQGVQRSGEGAELGLVQLHPIQPHRPVIFQVGQHEEQGQGRRRLGFRRRLGWFNVFGFCEEPVEEDEELKEKRCPEQPVLVSYGEVQETHLIVA